MFCSHPALLSVYLVKVACKIPRVFVDPSGLEEELPPSRRRCGELNIRTRQSGAANAFSNFNSRSKAAPLPRRNWDTDSDWDERVRLVQCRFTGNNLVSASCPSLRNIEMFSHNRQGCS